MQTERLVRVRPAAMGGPVAVRHPETGEYVVPNPAHSYKSTDAIVREYPWLFVDDETLAALPPQGQVDSVRVVANVARPGRRGRAA